MSDINIRHRKPAQTWSTAQKALIPLEGENRYFTAASIITGLTNNCSVLGDGTTTAGNLSFLETMNIETSTDLNLESLKISGNKCVIKNTHATNYININIGSTSSPEYLELGPDEFMNLKYNGSEWIYWDTSNNIMQKNSIYLMTTFYNQGLYLYASGDGKSWASLSGSERLYIAGDELRDPSIIYRHGKYWVCYTNVGVGAYDHNEFKIISSEDLITWSVVTTVDCSSIAGPPNVGARVWAPEWYVDTDDTVYIFVSIKPSAAGNHAGYYLIAQNDTMTSWSTPTLVTLTGGPTDWIDAFIIKIGSTYYMWYKDEVTSHIEYATGTTVTGPYTTQENGDWAGWGSGIEGPSLIQIDENTWRLYFHDYGTNGIWYDESSDNFSTWTGKTVIDEPGNPPPYWAGHCTVLKINDYKKLFHIFGLLVSKNNTFIHDISIESGIIIIDFNYGLRFLMSGVDYGHFLGTVTGDDTLYIDNRGAGSTRFRNYNAGWNDTLIMLNNGNVGINETSPTAKLHVTGLSVYANNAAALAGGLTVGAFYRTGGDPDLVCVVH